LILSKIIENAATRCHILKLKCTRFDFGRGSASDLTPGAYSAPPGLVAGFKGAYFSGKEGWEGRQRDRGRKSRGKERRGEGEEKR